MPFEKGDFLLVEYTVKVKEDDKIIETTDAEEAKKANIYREDEVYGPRLIILGEGWLLKAAEEELAKMQPGEEKVIELPPEKAFGQRDPSKIKVISARELNRRRIRPVLGAQIEIDGRIGIIRSIGSGRVVVDFNHPLAGKTIVYKLKVVRKLEDPIEKIRALLKRRAPRIDAEKVEMKIENGVLELKVPPELRDLEGVQILKRALVYDIKRYIKEPKITKVIFIEEYELAPPEAKEEAKEAKEAGEKSSEQGGAKGSQG